MLQEGRVVRCIAGHDKDRFYMVLQWRGDRVLIADGKTRKLAAPKAKNPKHLRPTKTVFCPQDVPTDKQLRLALAPFNRGEASEEEGGTRLV